MGFGSGPFGAGPFGGTPTVTFLDVYKEMQYTLLESGSGDANGTTMATPMFTLIDIQNALIQRQAQFMRDTGLIVSRTSFVTSPGNGFYPLPADCSNPYRLAWQPAPQPAGGTQPLSRVDEWSADHGMANWVNTPGTPLGWTQSTQGNQQVRLVPAPNALGQIDLIYIPLPPDGSTDEFILPIGFEIYVKWGALGDLFGREGESADPVRAAYCWQRWDEGIELARMLLEGSSAS